MAHRRARTLAAAVLGLASVLALLHLRFSAEEQRQSAPPTSLAPSFIIVGGEKCGTTSLYRYLLQHPHVVPLTAAPQTLASHTGTASPGRRREDRAKRQRPAKGNKEIRFFDRVPYEPVLERYLAYFPRRPTHAAAPVSSLSAQCASCITGEASPSYLYSPRAAARIATLVPGVKIIVLLRDPVERAWSHYQHMLLYRDLFVANRSFAELTAIEADLLLPACAGAPADPTDDDPVVLADHIDSTIPEYRTQCLQRVATSLMLAARFGPGVPVAVVNATVPSILHAAELGIHIWALQMLQHGMYADALGRFLDSFAPHHQILVLASENLFAQPAATMEHVARFLALDGLVDWTNVTDRAYVFGADDTIVERPLWTDRRGTPAYVGPDRTPLRRLSCEIAARANDDAAEAHYAHGASAVFRPAPAMDAATRARLAAHFAPHNRELAALLQRFDVDLPPWLRPYI